MVIQNLSQNPGQALLTFLSEKMWTKSSIFNTIPEYQHIPSNHKIMFFPICKKDSCNLKKI